MDYVLNTEYILCVTSIEGWVQQLSLEEFENFLASHKLLAKQMVGIKLEDDQSVLVAQRCPNFKRHVKEKDTRRKDDGMVESNNRNLSVTHVENLDIWKRNCIVKLKEGNVVE